MTIQAVVEWVFEPMIASIRREAYAAGREDAVREMQAMLTGRTFTNPTSETTFALREPEVN